ncbi:MAG TPA: ABC transporter permease [Bryobacteraceae bacterium]|jgi:predicted permease
MTSNIFRRFGGAPGFTMTVVGTLALTVALSTTVFSVLDAVFIRPLPYKEADRIFALRTISPQGYQQPASYPEFNDWRREAASFATVAGYNNFKSVNAEIGGSAISLDSVAVSDNFFDIFGVQPMLGRAFEKGSEDEGRNYVVVLSNEVWRTTMGSRANAIGEKIKLDGHPYEVVGVMPPGFRFPISESNAIYFPLTMTPNQRTGRGNHWLPTIAKLAPGVKREDAQQRFNGMFQHFGEVHPGEKNRRVRLIDLATFTVAGSDGALRLLLYAVMALIALGCVNLAGLLIAKGVSRQHEISVRSALGAARRRIIGELLWENIEYAVVGGVLGVVLAGGLLTAIQVLLTAALRRGAEVELNGTVLVASLAVSIVTSMAAGLWPALRLSRVSAAESLRSGQRAGFDRGQNRLRALFVTVQVSLALTLLVTSGLVFSALLRLRTNDFGFDPSHILSAEIDLSPGTYETRDVLTDFYTPLLEKVRAMHGVQAAGLIQIVPIQNWGWNSDVQIVGQPPPPPNQERLAEFRMVTAGYFPAFGVRLVRGRLLDDKLDTPTSQRVMVVNEKFVERYIPQGLDPIGQAISDGGDKVVIVGVASNVRQSVYQAPLAEMDYPISQIPANLRALYIASMHIVVRTKGDHPEAIVPDLRRTFGELDRTLPFRAPKTMTDVIADALTLERLENWLFGSFAVLALLLALVGLYGLVSHEVELSRREIGIRMAVGATRSRIFGRVYKRVGGMLAAGLVGGLLATWGARQLIGTVVPVRGGAGGEAWLLVGLSVSFMLVSLGAAFLPAWRAASVDPAGCLRSE